MMKTHIMFKGNCIDAINFYKEAFGAKVHSLIQKKDIKDIKDMKIQKDEENHVINCEISIHGQEFIFCDFVEDLLVGNHISFMVSLESEEKVREYYNILKDNGKCTISLCETPFSKLCFGIEDKFSLNWLFMLKK